MSAMEIDSSLPATTTTNDPATMIATGGATASSLQVIQSMHQDYILQVKFDCYGRRIATCSGDRFVRVWELQESGEWMLTSAWQAHKSAVTALDWVSTVVLCIFVPFQAFCTKKKMKNLQAHSSTQH